MNRDLINKEILKTKIKEIDIYGEGKNEKDAFANAFEKIKVISYELSQNLLISMNIIGVKINSIIKKEKKNILSSKKIQLDLKIKIQYKHLDIEGKEE